MKLPAHKEEILQPTKHIRKCFDVALYGLKNDVLMLSSLTDRIFQNAMDGLFKRDSELCQHVAAEEQEVDILQKQVNQDGVNLLIRFQPVASDMREAISAMRISTNLERIADQTITIARKAMDLNTRPPVPEVSMFELPHHLGVAIFRDSMRAYADRDFDLARTLDSKVAELSVLTRDITEKLVQRATVDAEFVPCYLDLIFIARALERIGDYSAYIAEDSFWRDRADDIHHLNAKKTPE
jgi:phosphate transport system protein